MKAVVFEKSIARFVAMKIAGPRRCARMTSATASFLSPIKLRDIAPPKLPSGEWVRVSPILAGICGSDLSVICAKGSPYFSPLTSTPFVLGHEVVGTVTEIGHGVGEFEKRNGLVALHEGDRVILEPALGCIVRGIEPLCEACRRGQNALCRNVTRGRISAGIQTGYCHDTGGAWSDQFVAHRSQLFPVAKEITNVAAVLAEPLSCVLHGVRRVRPDDDETILVIGCGSIGLLTIAALRTTGVRSRLVAIAKYDHQAEHALSLGADQVLRPRRSRKASDEYGPMAHALNAEMHFPELGRPTVMGGADVTFDCIGSSRSLDDAVRFTTGGGHVVLLGMPGVPSNVEWTSLWFKELTLHAAYAYGVERNNGSLVKTSGDRHTCEVALDLLRLHGKQFERLVGQPFPLTDYRKALRAALFAGSSGAVKTVFQLSP